MSQHRPRTGNQNGLSLVETLVSLLLLSFVVVGGIGVLMTSVKQNKLARYRSMATSVAAERLDALTSVRFSNAASYTDFGLPEETPDIGPPPTFTTDYGALPGFPEFRRVVTLDYDVPEAGLLRARVDVFWIDPQQGEKQHTLLTFLHPDLD